MHSIPPSPVTTSPPAAMQPYDPPTCPPPVYRQQDVSSSAASSVWSSCGALSSVSNESSIVDALSTSSSIVAPPLPFPHAEACETSRPLMARLPMCDLPMDKDGDLEVETVNLSIQSLKELRSFCVAFHIPHSSTKLLLRNRLVQYSQAGMAKWKADLLPHARIAHKGVRSGGIKKPNRLQARLLAAEQRLGTQPIHPVRGSKDKRTQAEVDGLLLWADEMVEKINAAGPTSHPLRHSHLPNNRQLSSMPIRVDGSLAAKHLLDVLKKVLPEIFVEADLTTVINQCLVEATESNTIEKPTSESVTDSSAEDGPFSSPLMPISTHDYEFTADVTSDSVADSSAEAGPSSSFLMSSQTLAPSQPEHSMTQPAFVSTGLTGGIVGVQESLRLADGQVLFYTEAMLPKNPPTRYGNDLDRLITGWSDGNLYYEKPLIPFYPIVVNGIPVPIKYWRDMYMRKNGQWKVLKGPWTNWKHIMESYEALGPTAFWDRYSDKKMGQRFSLMGISKILRDEWKAENVKLVQEAHATLGENLNDLLKYRRGKSTIMMTRVTDIARLYREKRNDENKENQ
ncbi:hypothetical protein IW261DRAFT_1417905 [Armillaria novae-zelandiae]|uniref:SAP domain-containing protein n=1 Tax=Armillaria novae-zelandiae TaxID=153914 RepID=A0AA39PDM1_9AGAR|nr:hypothetical protein IW261DRAFT_1417905 [Armillaria novae-zelandiae]